jgi:ArsR family transcriptional regulator, arsenate/arsenite/antimonite-responsive transcriptional repressor
MMFIVMQENMLPDNKKTREQAELFAALADPTRLKLLQVLCRQNPPGCRCVNNLSLLLGISQPAVSQHLRVLKAAGLVTGERRGYRMHYTIDTDGFKRCRNILAASLVFNQDCEENPCQQNCHPTTDPD